MFADMACMYYAADFYQKLPKFEKDKIKLIGNECSELSLRLPLHEYHEREFVIKEYDSEYKMTGLQVIALMAVSTDILADYQLSEMGMSFPWLRSARVLAKEKKT